MTKHSVTYAMNPLKQISSLRHVVIPSAGISNIYIIYIIIYIVILIHYTELVSMTTWRLSTQTI